jgi:hypothetical protein
MTGIAVASLALLIRVRVNAGWLVAGPDCWKPLLNAKIRASAAEPRAPAMRVKNAPPVLRLALARPN